MVTTNANELGETSETRQDPRVKRTRELIQRAFMELVQERGFEALRVQDIAERATINRATFYAHFVDKYSLLDTMMKEQFAADMARRLEPGAPLTVANLRALASGIFALVDDLDGHCMPTNASAQNHHSIEAAVQRELAGYLTSWLRRAMPASITSASAPAIETAASVMSWAIFGAAQDWSRGERTTPLEVAVKRLVSALVDGVAQTTRIAIPG
jgi:AcrR family transcriptional regulator